MAASSDRHRRARDQMNARAGGVGLSGGNPLVAVLAICVAAAVGLGIAGEVSAEEGLGENEIRWISYPETNTERNKEGLGSVVWGGGSFMKLVSKLAIEGCDVNALVAVTPEGDQLLHHFQAPNFVNRSFGDGNYMRQVPAMSNVGFSCVDVCDIYIGPGAAEGKRTRETCKSADDYIEYASVNEYFDFHTKCIKDFTEEVEEGFFSNVAMFQDPCIAYFKRETSASKVWGVSYGSISNYRRSFYYMRHQPFIIASNDRSEKDLSEGPYSDYFYHVKTILHEMCHQRQDWYLNKFYSTYDDAELRGAGWYRTIEGREFIEVTGYEHSREEGYYLEDDSEYNFGGNQSPIELAADVCAWYILEEKILKNYYPEFYEENIRNAILTPEIIKWVEKYFIVG